MPKEITIEEMRALAERNHQAKLDAGERLIALRDQVKQAAESYRTSKEGFGVAYADAVRAGWTEDELKEAGIERPAPPAKRRATRGGTKSKVTHDASVPSS